MYNAFAMQQNVLDNQLKIDRSSALQGQTRQNALNAFTQGVGEMYNAPVRMEAQQNALGQQRVQGAAQERAFIAPILDGVSKSSDPARAYAEAVRQVEAAGIDIPDELEAYDPDNFAMLRSLYSMPEAELTDFQRSLQGLGPDEVAQARRVRLGLAPSADAQLRGQTGDKPTTGMREYEFAQQQGFPGTFQQWKELNRSKGMEITSDGKGGFTITQGGGTGDRKERKLTERQSQLTLFGNQMEKMAPVLDDLELRFDPTNVPDAAATAMGTFGNFIRSEEKQRYEAAANAWAEGVLRIQTGAAATQPEIDRVVRTYFASLGDEPSTVKFKRELREGFFKSVEAASGGVFQEGDSEPLQNVDQFDATRDIDGTTYVQKNGKWFIKP